MKDLFYAFIGLVITLVLMIITESVKIGHIPEKVISASMVGLFLGLVAGAGILIRAFGAR